MMHPMLQSNPNAMRPAGLSAGGAFLRSEAWQSGLLHRAYSSADVWASNPLTASREFEPHRFHHQSSGAVAVDAETTPDHRPGDEPAATTVLSNIRFDGRIFQSRQSHPFNPKDELREHSPPRKAD
jgi:hypothetical protein